MTAKNHLSIRDLIPSKGMFLPGEVVELYLELDSVLAVDIVVDVRIHYFNQVVDCWEQKASLNKGYNHIIVKWPPPQDAYGGYGVELSILSSDARSASSSTAFDIHNDWLEFPRYGFLMNFSPNRPISELNWLKKFHINGLQFYDWQYRHDALIPETDIYFDPFRREMSLKVVRDLIASAHRANMATMPYLAVYAASLEFWNAHPEWVLHDVNGVPLTFHDFLGYMDPSPQSGWTKHLLRECARIDSELEFDGYHIDQYGEPKQAYDVYGEEVDLPSAFSRFVEALKRQTPKKSTVFNAVGNWPIEALASSLVDFVYIEVWPPDTRYEDLARIVQNARELSGKKPVVIALYIPASQSHNLRLAEAVLFANGSTHIAVGEKGLLLSDPYFPHSDPLPVEIEEWLLKYWDFLIRYQNLLGPAAGHVAEDRYRINADQVLISGRSQGNLEMVSLINFSGLPQAEWAEGHGAPDFVENLTLLIKVSLPVNQVWTASPDCKDSGMMPASWEITEDWIIISVPSLSFWTTVFVEYNTLELM